MTESLDAADRSIIRLLRLNARRPNSEIAAEVGLSPSACHRRIRMLEAGESFVDIRSSPPPSNRKAAPSTCWCR